MPVNSDRQAADASALATSDRANTKGRYRISVRVYCLADGVIIILEFTARIRR